MNRTSKLFLVAMAVAAATISAQETTTVSSDPTTFSDRTKGESQTPICHDTRKSQNHLLGPLIALDLYLE